jgi:RHS repeat-associated protein
VDGVARWRNRFSFVDSSGGQISGSITTGFLGDEQYLLTDPWHWEDIEQTSYNFSIHLGNVYQIDFSSTAFFIRDDITGEWAGVYPGETDLRWWFTPAVDTNLQFSLTRWNHDLRVRAVDGTEYPISNIVSHQADEYFDAIAPLRSSLKWWIWDATTGQESPANITDLRSWIAVQPAWNLTATLTGQGTGALNWHGPGGATRFEVIRTAAGTSLPIGSVDGETAEASYVFVDPLPAPGTVNQYHIVAHFADQRSANSESDQIVVPSIVGPLAGIPSYEQDGVDGYFFGNAVLRNSWIPVASLGVTRSPGGGSEVNSVHFNSGSRVPAAPSITLLPCSVLIYISGTIPIYDIRPDAVTIEYGALGSYSGIKIERRKRNTEWAVVQTLSSPSGEVIDDGLESGEVYYYRARASNGAGLSEPTRMVRWIPPLYFKSSWVWIRTWISTGPSAEETYPDQDDDPPYANYNSRDIEQPDGPSRGAAIDALPGFPSQNRAIGQGAGFSGAGHGYSSHVDNGELIAFDNATGSRNFVSNGSQGHFLTVPGVTAKFSFMTVSTRYDENNEYKGYRAIQQKTLSQSGAIAVDVLPEVDTNLNLHSPPALCGTDSFSPSGEGDPFAWHDRHLFQRSLDWDEELYFEQDGHPEQVKITIARGLSHAQLELLGSSNRFVVYGHIRVPDPVVPNAYIWRADPLQTGDFFNGYAYLSVAPKTTGSNAANLNDSVIVKARFTPQGGTHILEGTTEISDQIKVTYTGNQRPPVYEFSAQEASGPSYRRVNLSGRPLPDNEPGDKSENEAPLFGTFVDALTLQVQHRVEDVSIPIAGSPLSLSANRRMDPTIWSTAKGLTPEQEVYRPFGPCWSSGLGMHLKIVSQTGQDTFAYVTDYAGGMHRFVWSSDTNPGGSSPGGGNTLGNGVWVPLPSGKHEGVADGFSLSDSLFKAKNGTEICFEAIPQLTNVVTGPASAGSVEYHSYCRPVWVKDAVGNKLVCEYVDGFRAMPKRILLEGKPQLSLSILYDNQNRVRKVWDPKGNVTEYTYEFHGGVGSEVLKKVISNGRQLLAYEYEVTWEYDRRPRGIAEPINWYGHCNVSAILDGKSNRYAFSYDWDLSKSAYHSGTGTYIQSGLPRTLRSVKFPDGNNSWFVPLVSQAMILSADRRSVELIGGCKTKVTDLEGAEMHYEFSEGEAHLIDMTRWVQDQSSNAISERQTFPSIVTFYRAMELTYVGYGVVRYEFEPDAGMTLSSVTDLAGRTTSYAFTETSRSATAYDFVGEICPSLGNWARFHGEPTWVENAAGQRRYFAYNKYRERVGTIDETGRASTGNHWLNARPTEQRSWQLSPAALAELPTQVAVGGVQPALDWMAGSPQLAAQTFYEYDLNFPGVVTRETVKSLAGDPAWAADLVTVRQLDNEGRVEKQTVGDVVTEMTYDLNGNLTSVTDGRLFCTTFLYDSRNRSIRSYVPTPAWEPLHFREIQYDAAGNKSAERDERGYWTYFDYDPRNRLSAVRRFVSGSHEITRYEYNKVGSETKVTDPRGTVTTKTYDDLQRLETVTEAVGQPEVRTTAYAYPVFAGGTDNGAATELGNGFQVTKTTDPRGFITRTSYDDLGRVKRTSIAYNTPGQNPVVGGVGVATTEMQYDDAGRVTAVIDPLNKTTQTSYDALGRPEIVTYADNTAQNPKFSQNYYTLTGLKWKARDEAGNFSETHYDGAGRAVRELGPVLIDGSRPETLIAFDASGNVAEKQVRRTAGVNGLFSTWNYLYDGRNRKIRETGPLVETGRPMQQWAYDAAGNVAAVQDARGKTTNMSYDERNRVRFVTAPDVKNVEGATVRPVMETRYDLNGNIVRVIDAELRHTVNEYDRLNRLTKTTDHAAIAVAYGYDAAGNRTSVKDGKNQITAFTYDGLKRLKSETPPAGVATTYTYDAVNLTSKVDPVTSTAFVLYDARHRLKQTTSDSQFTRVYGYDEVGRLNSVVDSGYNVPSATGYVYDEAGRLISETNSNVTHTYEYDLAGNRVLSLQGENGGGARRAIESDYDAAGRLKTMRERPASEPVGTGRLTSYFYDGNGNIVRKELPNGVQELTSYDALNRRRLQVTKHGVNYLLTSEQFYDRSGNVRVIEERVASDSTKDRRLLLEYDGASRLTWEKTKRWDGTTGQWEDNGATEYLYDAANNRTWKKAYPPGQFATPNATWESTYNALNQLTSYVHQVGGVTQSTATYTYDAAGRRTQRTRGTEQITYAYNVYHQLGLIQQSNGGYPGPRRFFGYDYRARRIFQQSGNGTSANGTIKRVVFSGGTSVREYDTTSTTSYYESSGDLYFSGSLPASGTTSAEFVRGSDWGGGVGGLLYSLRPELGVDAPRYTHYDGRGDVVLQTGPGGQSIFEAAYEAFGTRTRESGSTLDRQRANTKEEETTFQLLNEGHRYRDLETGVWLTRDPAGFVDGPNLYAYVQQNPWSKFDPEGLKANDGDAYGKALQANYDAHRGIFGISDDELAHRNSKAWEQHILPRLEAVEAATVLRKQQQQIIQFAGEVIVAGADVVTTLAPIPQSNAEAGTALVGGAAAKAAGKYVKKAFGWAKEKLAKKGGIYEFPDQKAGGAPYVGQSEDLDTRLKKHESTGRLKPGTETTTDVAGDKTTREVAEHKRIQEITGGVQASKSDAVSNKIDPIGPKRKHLLDDQ